MISYNIGFNWIGLVLVAMTVFFVIHDRAFRKSIRIEFHVSALLCLYMIILSNLLFFDSFSGNVTMNKFVAISDLILKPVIILILAHIFISVKKSKSDFIFALVLVAVMAIALVIDINIGVVSQTSSILCIVFTTFYYYFAVQTYKRDNLTNLMLRHNLNLDMNDLANKEYDIVLIDVDNFKLINDKYGHDKGDEVLVTIASVIGENLPKGCKFYRFGGDEFVVISRKVEADELIGAFEKINSLLSADELRVSYGIVRHSAGENGIASLNEADKRMYENKKLIKSEDIWDDMTGLYNYKGFIDELDAFRKSVAKDGNSMALIAVDVERLNNINMAYGYTEGNLAIKTLSRVIKSCLKGRDFIGHLGSDEYAIAIECFGDQDEHIISFIDQINEGVSSAFEFANKDYSLKINVGKLIVDNDDETSSEELVNNVLYMKQTDKEDRRKTSLLEEEQDYDDQEEAMVKDILDNNRFRYAFQPIVSAKSGEIVAYEALMRTVTETMVSPLKILKYAERNKRLYDVEKYTFFNVLSHVSETKCIPEGRKVFINSLPGYMLKEIDYDLLKNKYSNLFDGLVIEITEQREINDEALSKLNVRRDRDGFSLAIDDYGSGCSNTNSLLRYMPQVIKLDRLLITGIDRNAKKQFFVNSIISFARENDMMILAEGVETESELKTVIRLGVDMIQGFLTAKPSFDVIEAIPKDIVKLIVDENMKVGNQRMVYTASSNCELSVVHLAMEDYSKVNISGEKISLIGSSEYTADMVVRIKEGVTSRLTLNDVLLNSVDDEPCIDIGEGANLTIRLEGNNKLNAKGIRVPEGSTLTITGSGNLDIYSKGIECYGIGNDTESGFGKIIFKNSGNITLHIDGEHCIGIGGGVASENSEVSIYSGKYQVNVAGVEAAGIGCFQGKLPIYIKDCIVNSEFRVNKGIVFGTMNGINDICLENFQATVDGSGTEVCCIGSINESSGNVIIKSGSCNFKINGQKLYLIGCKEGQMNIDISHARIELTGEGDNVLGFGSHDNVSHINTSDSSLALVINASSPHGFGVVETEYGFAGAITTVRINGVEMPIV